MPNMWILGFMLLKPTKTNKLPILDLVCTLVASDTHFPRSLGFFRVSKNLQFSLSFFCEASKPPTRNKKQLKLDCFFLRMTSQNKKTANNF